LVLHWRVGRILEKGYSAKEKFGIMKRSAFRLGCVALAALAFTIVPCRGEANNSKLDGLPVRNTGQYATIETDKGNIVVELYPAVAPKTVANFEKLSKDGFYNNLTFHRVEPGFVIQGGDPAGNGTGGPGYEIPAEISPTEKHLRGTIAMARTGDNVNPEQKSSGSQFYICLNPAPFLDGQYTLFGGVVEGMDVVDKIKVGDHIKKIVLSDSLPK
jgi:peptidyl-prolyl cis-trans isomerase B (cyclophilin B)